MSFVSLIETKQFGIPKIDKSKFLYVVAADDAEDLIEDELSPCLIQKRIFISSLLVSNYIDYINLIEKAFDLLKKNEKIDSDGYYIENYKKEENVI